MRITALLNHSENSEPGKRHNKDFRLLRIFIDWRCSYRLVTHSLADPEQAPVGDQGPDSAVIRADHAVRTYESIFSFGFPRSLTPAALALSCQAVCGLCPLPALHAHYSLLILVSFAAAQS
jgi:hypothetical protein